MERTLTAEERRTFEAMKKDVLRWNIWDYLFVVSATVFVLWFILKLSGAF